MTDRASLLRMAEACERAAAHIDENDVARHEPGVCLEDATTLRTVASLLRQLAAADVEGVAGELEDEAALPHMLTEQRAKLLRTAARLLRASAAREAEAVEREREECAKECEENCADATERHAIAARDGDKNGIAVWSASVIACKADAKRIRARGTKAKEG